MLGVVALTIHIGGSGLGLFISRRLAKMRGGAIGFASKPGIGSTFCFFVKSKISDVGPRQESSPWVEPSARTNTVLFRIQSQNWKDNPGKATTPVEKDFYASDMSILIVEDNLINQRVLAKQLRNLGIKVSVANHGKETLEYLHTTNYCRTDESASKISLILMDWEIPVMSGITCVRHIRQLQRDGVVQGHVPVIAVTANVRSEQVKVTLEAGIDDGISKLFTVPELSAHIKNTLRSTVAE